MSPSLLTVLVGAEGLLAAAASRFPRAFARLAVLPVGKPITLALPSRVTALILPPRGGTGTYRAAPDRELTLAPLPGEARVAGDRHILTFVPGSNQVVAKARGLTSILARVDVSETAGNLVLKAYRFPSEIPWLVILVTALTRYPSLIFAHLSSTLFLLGFLALRVWGQPSARGGVAAIAEEMRRRIAIANGDSPPAPVAPAPPKVLADEWLCACGRVNKARRACGRCWAQQPTG